MANRLEDYKKGDKVSYLETVVRGGEYLGAGIRGVGSISGGVVVGKDGGYLKVFNKKTGITSRVCPSICSKED